MSKIETPEDGHDICHDTGGTPEACAQALHLQSPARGRRLTRPGQPATTFTYEQRLLILDTWRRSGLPAGDFAPLVGLSKHTLYEWKRRFEADGPAGLADKLRGSPAGSRLPEVTRRTIVMLKQSHPDWGCQRISDMLLRGPALSACPGAVARVLHEAGYETEEARPRPTRHPSAASRGPGPTRCGRRTCSRSC